MTRIIFAPAQELVVHEVVEVSRDDLLLERITPSGNMPLYWCSGILFSFSSVPMTDEVIKEYLKGRIHWLEVHYTRMEKYTPLITFESSEYRSTMNIKIIDTSISEMHNEFVKWLKYKTKGDKK